MRNAASRLLLACGAAVLVAACAGARVSPAALAGVWAPLSAQMGGRDLPLSFFEGATLHLGADSYEFAGDRGSVTYLPRSQPARMDILGREGPNAGRTIPAIYALRGDTLTICYQLGQGERPAAFATTAGTRLFLVRYRRVR